MQQLTVRTADVCAYHCAQSHYTIQYRTYNNFEGKRGSYYTHILAVVVCWCKSERHSNMLNISACTVRFKAAQKLRILYEKPVQTADQVVKFAHLLGFALLSTLTLLVYASEIGDDHGHRQRNDQNSTQRTNSADELARDRRRHHIAVPVDATPAL